jgi:hypothetical protein
MTLHNFTVNILSIYKQKYRLFLVNISSWNFREVITHKFKKLMFTHVIENSLGARIRNTPATLPQYLHIALTAVATVHVGKSTE